MSGNGQTPLFLVSGGAGFIGSHLVEHLVAEGMGVRVLDDFSTGRRENLEPWMDSIELLEGTVADPAVCRRACEGVAHVLHQAALPSVPRSVVDPATTHDVCATGTLNLLVAAREAGVRRFVYAGSSSAYGDTRVLPKTEEMPGRPQSPYAVAKLSGELYCRAFFSVYKMETVVLRYFNIFGPRQDPGSEYSAVIPIFIAAALSGRVPTIHGDGEQTRDFTFVDNVVQANLKACFRPASAVAGEVFNVGCGDRISLNSLWARIRDSVGASVEAHHGPPRAGDVRDSQASLVHIRARMEYEPSVDLETGLRRTVRWLREEEGGSPSSGR